LNSTSLSGDAPAKTKYTSRSGVMAGAVVDLRVADDAWVSLQPTFQERGTNSQVQVASDSEPEPGLEVDLTYVAVPLALRVTSDDGRIYALGGVSLAWLLAADLRTPDGQELDAQPDLRPVDLAADFGLGAMLPVRGAFLNLEIRYEQSVLNLARNDRDVLDSGIPTRLRQSGFQFLAGIHWPLGGD
jgi:hypothetical protein